MGISFLIIGLLLGLATASIYTIYKKVLEILND
jgi:hypothetical protein